MEKARRDNLRGIVAKAREAIEGSLARQLAIFGFFRDSEPRAKDDLSLRPELELLYPRLRDGILREGRALGKEGRISPEAVDRFVRESGATWVNRLAALRALEARGLLSPAAAYVSDEYGGASPRGIKLRETAVAEGRSMSRDDSIRSGIEDACQELGASVRVLFDLADEQSLLWPDAAALRQVLNDFSVDVTKADWAEPDVLGWVYQYYNTDANAALKKRKKTTGFKFAPDDIPIANQFYTPPWVVRVLADNTLGRLWLEAQDRLPRLATEPYRLVEARNGVPSAATEPDEFQRWLREEPDPLADGTVDRLCRFLVPLPSRPLPRARKSVREIRILDPACGSGHFLVYAFDLLFAMYREAEPDLDPREIPSLILANNLFGIDIDLRAAQLAAFTLYLKALATLATVDATAVLEVHGLNIVVADSHLGDGPRKLAFLDRYKDDPEVRQLYAKVLSDLDHTNVLGSLLKVRTEFESLFGRVRDAKSADSGWSPQGQQPLLDVSRQTNLTETFRSLSGRAWTIGDLLAELRSFEQAATAGQDIGSRLFYSDVERSVGLLALLSQQYDVILMNPPYGEMPPDAKDYLAGDGKRKVAAHYPRTAEDLDAAFIEQGLDLALPNGFVGALVPWTNMFKWSLAGLRRELLYGQARPEFLQEYGYGILDGATVGTIGLVARRLPSGLAGGLAQHACAFNRISDRKRDLEKRTKFLETFLTFALSGPNAVADWFVARLGTFEDMPGMSYAYWASDSLRALFRTLPPLDCDQRGVLVASRPRTKIADVKQGLATADDSRFIRNWWEVPSDAIGTSQRWRPFAKGGADVRFYTRIDLVVNWANDGQELKNYPKAVIRNPQFYFRPGVTWPRASWRLRKFGFYADGCLFADKGPSVFGTSMNADAITGMLNSSVGTIAMLMQTPERMWEIGLVSAVPMPTGTVPESVTTVVSDLVTLHRRRHEGDETCRDFTTPELARAWRAAGQGHLIVERLLSEAIDLRRKAEVSIEAKLGELDSACFDLYKITQDDRVLIKREMARRSEPDPDHADDDSEGAHEEGDAENEERPQPERSAARTRDLVARWISVYLKGVLEADEDGIIPVLPTRIRPGLVVRLQESIERDLGKDAVAALLVQAPRYLGTATLVEWLGASHEDVVAIGEKKVKLPVGFFPWHVDVYQKRPIFWLLSSEGFERGETRLRFQVYLHYLKLTPDTLRRVVSHFLEPMIEDDVQKEWMETKAKAMRLEGKARATVEKDAQDWLNTLDALKRFRVAVEGVIQGPPTSERVPANSRWLARTTATVRGGQDVGHGYQPKTDYGVRVNIAPLVEARLLPRLALKKLGG